MAQASGVFFYAGMIHYCGFDQMSVKYAKNVKVDFLGIILPFLSRALMVFTQLKFVSCAINRMNNFIVSEWH